MGRCRVTRDMRPSILLATTIALMVPAPGHAQPLTKPAPVSSASRPAEFPGPPDRDGSKAWRLAAAFLARQPFASDYATQGSAVGPVAGMTGCFDVEFASLGTNETAQGVVRADIVKRECAWLGQWGPEFLKREIERIETLCTPDKGSTRQQVEERFGAGKPIRNSKGPATQPVPEESPIRAYPFGTNGTLVVYYNGDGKVRSAHYFDPYSLKGRAAGERVPPAEQVRELTPRLRQMERILAEYQSRFGSDPKPAQPPTNSNPQRSL
jgi:hypothetical protein